LGLKTVAEQLILKAKGISVVVADTGLKLGNETFL
jgi:hypothetical protein